MICTCANFFELWCFWWNSRHAGELFDNWILKWSKVAIFGICQVSRFLRSCHSDTNPHKYKTSRSNNTSQTDVAPFCYKWIGLDWIGNLRVGGSIEHLVVLITLFSCIVYPIIWRQLIIRLRCWEFLISYINAGSEQITAPVWLVCIVCTSWAWN